MKIIKQELKKGEISVIVENLDDLWYLSQIIEKGDKIKGKTLRKIKIGKEGDRKQNIVKKAVFVKIIVDKTELSDQADSLRVGGAIEEGPEDITKGSHHSFNIEIRTSLTIEKEKWLNFQLEKIKDASQTSKAKILICVFDREEAYFAKLKRSGYEILAKIKGDVQKKRAEADFREKDFYQTIVKNIEEYVKRLEIDYVIAASPAFYKKELLDRVNNAELKKKIITATCSTVNERGIDEVIKREEVQTVLKEARFAEEIRIVEELLKEISKNGPAEYGEKEIENAVNSGAVKILLVTDKFIKEKKKKEEYNQLEELLKLTEELKGTVHIISSEHEGGKRVDGLGGIAAILRFKI